MAKQTKHRRVDPLLEAGAPPLTAKRRWNLPGAAAIIAIAMCIAGCGGGGGGEDDGDGPDPEDPPETGPAAIEGAWTGSALHVASGEQKAAVLIANRAGDSFLYVLRGVDSIVVRGNACCDANIDGDADGWTLVNQKKTPAPVHLLITNVISGSKVLSGDVTVEGVRYELNLSPDPDYVAPLSLASLAGHYVYQSPSGSTVTFDIAPTGAFTGADALCEFTGQVRVPDSSRNLFEFASLQVVNCATQALMRQGTYSGLGYVNGLARDDEPNVLGFIVTGALVYPFVIPGATASSAALTLTATPTSLEYGGTTQLSWLANALSACTASDAWSGNKAPATGSESSAALTRDSTFTLTCSGGGVTRSVSTTVTVATLPPDPGSAGDSTVAGVDANTNGVRDDIERLILQTHAPGQTRKVLLQRAVVMGEALSGANDPPQAEAALIKLFENLECLYEADAQSARTKSSEMVASYLNTPERAKAYIDFGAAAGGTIVEARTKEQLTTACAQVTP